MLPLAILSVITASALFTYMMYVQIYEINPQYSRFPPAVAKELRKAIYYTEIDPNPQKAMEYYKSALRVCQEERLHPFSDEVLGIKLQVVNMLIKTGLYERGVALLEKVLAESLEYVSESRKALVHLVKSAGEPYQIGTSDPNAEELLYPSEDDVERESRRVTKTVKKAIGMCLLLGSLYLDEPLKNYEKAQIYQTNAVNLTVREMKIRTVLGRPAVATPEEEEADIWMTLDEIGHTMTDLGETYLRQHQIELAVPLFLRALALIREAEGTATTCRQVVLLSNIASAMYSHHFAQFKPKDSKALTKEERQELGTKLDAARQWAEKTLEVANKIQGSANAEERVPECDLSCASAADTLALITYHLSEYDKSRRWLEEEKRYLKLAQAEERVHGIDKNLKELEELARSDGMSRK
jgi:tetratricopeptide (TPR) repeat protein